MSPWVASINDLDEHLLSKVILQGDCHFGKALCVSLHGAHARLLTSHSDIPQRNNVCSMQQ